MDVTELRVRSPVQPPDVVEFYALWLAAALAYGAGDTVTSLAILDGQNVVVEANLLIQALFDVAGIPGLVALKIAVIVACLLASTTTERFDRDPIVYYGPPVLLAVVGGLATVNNASLLGW